MIIGFIIWTITSLVLFSIGIVTLRSEKPAGFFTGVKPPEVKDTKKYNRAVAILWFVYAGLLELCGVPLLFLEQNSAGFVPVLFLTVAISIGLVVAYTFIEKKHRQFP